MSYRTDAERTSIEALDYIADVLDRAGGFIRGAVPLSRRPPEDDYDVCRLEFNTDRMLQDVLGQTLTAMYHNAQAADAMLRSLEELRERNP